MDDVIDPKGMAQKIFFPRNLRHLGSGKLTLQAYFGCDADKIGIACQFRGLTLAALFATGVSGVPGPMVIIDDEALAAGAVAAQT